LPQLPEVKIENLRSRRFGWAEPISVILAIMALLALDSSVGKTAEPGCQPIETF
jgi:hypothetical protein